MNGRSPSFDGTDSGENQRLQVCTLYCCMYSIQVVVKFVVEKKEKEKRTADQYITALILQKGYKRNKSQYKGKPCRGTSRPCRGQVHIPVFGE